MLNRIRQFYAALGAKVQSQELQWVRDVLPPGLLELFYGMDSVDQRHALDVAVDAGKYAQPEVDEVLLTQAALLHDCGKQKGELSIILRAFVVLSTKLVPAKAQHYAKEGRPGTLGHALWLSYNHPQRGAEWARVAGADHKLCKLIAEHHLQPGPKSSPEHLALYRADQDN